MLRTAVCDYNVDTNCNVCTYSFTNLANCKKNKSHVLFAHLCIIQIIKLLILDYSAINASVYVQSASITPLIATFDATHPPSRISQNTRHCSAAHAVCASAHGCRPCRAASGAPPVPSVGEPPTPPPLPEPGPPTPGCTPDACEPGGAKPLLMASACSDIIRRLAACRSASRSSAVWRLELRKQHTNGYTAILVN